MILLKIFIINAIFLTLSAPAIADVVQGTAELCYLCGDGWDFSDSAFVHIDEADMFFMEVYDPNWGFVITISSFTGSMFATVQDSSFEELTTAPADSSIYSAIIEPCVPMSPIPCLFYTYVIRTPDDHYAKFKISVTSPCQGFCIRYAYQTDGSRNLDTGVPVGASTWGRIKALYSD